MKIDDLLSIAKQAGEFPPLPQEEQQKDPPGKRFVQTVKDIGGKAMGGAAVVGGTIANLGKPAPLQKMNPKY